MTEKNNLETSIAIDFSINSSEDNSILNYTLDLENKQQQLLEQGVLSEESENRIKEILDDETSDSDFLTSSEKNWGSISIKTLNNLSAKLNAEEAVKEKFKISPTELFAFLFKNLKTSEKNDLKEKMNNFWILYHAAKNQGSLGLKEKARDTIIELEKELTASVCGFTKYILKDHISVLQDLLKTKVVKLSNLIDYPRIIPKEVLKKLKAAQKKNIFKEFHILYIDYTKETSKSNATKIKEKDPILFGKISKNSEKLFYIADWIDEYCDLTISKFAEILKTKNKEFEIPELKEISPRDIKDLFVEKETDQETLKKTNRANFESLHDQELKKDEKKNWFQKLKTKLQTKK